MKRCLLRMVVSTLAATCAAAGTAATAGEDRDASCVEVEVNGYRTLSIECLNRQLMVDPAKTSRRDTPPLASEAVARMPSNRLGLFNRAATQVRMGRNFGRSAFPQRPAPPKPPSPLMQGR